MTLPRGQPERFFRFDYRKLPILFLPLAALIGLSVLVNADAWRNAPLSVYAAFGGVGLFLVLGSIIMPQRLFLHLTPEGLTIHYLTSRRHYSWDEAQNFRVTEGPYVRLLSTGRRIVFDLAEGSAQRTTAVRMVASINGYDVSIMDWFNVGAEKLARELNAWQQRYDEGTLSED